MLPSVLVVLDSRPLLVWESDREITARPSLMSHQRNARTSPRRAPVPAPSSRKVPRHQGPVAAAMNVSCCAVVRAKPRRFLGIGGSLADTGFTVTSPHLIAREKALERTPAMLR